MTASARAGTPWEQLNFTEPFVSSSERRLTGLPGEGPRPRAMRFQENIRGAVGEISCRRSK